MSVETFLGGCLVVALAANAFLLRRLSIARQDDSRSLPDSTPIASRSNDPGPRAHADCTPGERCLTGRSECPCERQTPTTPTDPKDRP